MAGPSTLMAQAMVNHLMRYGTDPYTVSGTWKLKLYTSNPDFDAGTGGTELTGTGYTAGGASLTMSSATWNAATTSSNGYVVDNSGTLATWTATAADWSGAITGAAVVNGSAAIMWGAALDNARTVGNGDTFRFSANACKLTLDTASATGTMSNHWKSEVLDHFCCTDRTYAPTNPCYMALFTAAPDFQAGTGGTEVTVANNYSRKSLALSSAIWDTADASGNVDNTAEIAFGAATGSWGTVVAAALVSSSSGAFTMYAGNSFTGQAIGNGDTFKIAAGDFNVSIA